MADQTGTNGNDVFFFNGALENLTMTIVNPYTGETFTIDDDKNVNQNSYEGLAGIDTLFMTNKGDAIFVEDRFTGQQRVHSVEVFIAGDGGDVVHLASTNYELGDIIVDGGDAEDLIWSNVGDDELFGRGGDDIMDGGPGNDILWGGGGNGQSGSGNDTLSGGDGADMLHGEDGNDTLVFTADAQFESIYRAYNIGTPTVEGTGDLINISGFNLSKDIFDGGEGYDTIVMTDGNDAFFLDNPFHEFHSDGSSLRIIDIEQIDAGAGDDVVDLTNDQLGYGDIVMNGGDGNDYLWSSDGNDTINGDAGDDDIYGGGGDDTLNGGTGNDTINGSIGNDTIRGGAGNDVIYGGVSSTNSAYVTTTTTEHTFNSTVVFPSLAERVNISDLTPPGDTALGVAAGDLSVSYATTAEITFLSTGASYKNSLGFYNIAQDGTILSVELAFENVKTAGTGATSTINLPGAPDTDFGFFIVANGANKNNNYAKMDEPGHYEFIYNHGKSDERAANINDSEDDIALVYIFDDGSKDQVVVGSNNHIYHTTTRGGDTTLNGDNKVHVVSGLADENDDTTLRIGFEDLPNLGDADYNDVVFDLTVNGQTVIVPLVDDNDIIDGGAGDDYINGGIGDDIIMGGEGADILFGDQGVDTFLYQALSDAGDTIMDFETGPGGDILNLTDVLEGFDAQLDDINDFMQIVHNGGSDELHINADGQGNDFVTLVTFDGGLGGLGISDLVNNGQIVTDQSIVI
ncbi:MAG: DUF4114 domain-containing protein [Pseudomonadota bacterium]|nr:DUF4114 domain-containing protein [Pseudomonadota bacterium]